MIAICVDDELIPLESIRKAIESSDHVSKVFAFDDEEEALAFARNHVVDVAFLDIELHAMNGLEMAEELVKIHPNIAIVFCSSYEQYAVRAIQLHMDIGYLIKPFRTSQVHDELLRIANKRRGNRKIKVQCFGDFEVFVDNKPVAFKRKKAKELFAYLIDRRGSTVNTNQICTVLWEDESDDEKKRDYVYHLISDIRTSFGEEEMDGIILSQGTGYSVDITHIDCDYYHLLDGDKEAIRSYAGEYMRQYSWAEFTNAWINGEKRKK